MTEYAALRSVDAHRPRTAAARAAMSVAASGARLYAAS
jgi:hypothetical protein